LALLFGAALPAAAELEPLIEGYGAWLAKAPDPDPQLKALDLPPLPAATGELRSAMALSFVRFLIAREKEEGIRRLFATAQPGRVEVAVQEIYGLGLSGLDRAWREQLSRGEPKVRAGQFLRMSVRYLRPYKWKQAEIFLYMLFALAFNTVFPFVTRTLFDTALPSGEFIQVLQLLIGLGIALLVSLFAGLRQAYLSAWVSGAVVRDMRAQMFEKLQILSTGWFRRHQQGDVLTRLFSDVAVVEQGLASTLRDGIFQVLSLVVSAIVMLTLNLWLGLLVLAAAPLVALVYRAMSAGARDRGLAVQEDTAALMGVAAENYAAEPVVKLFGLQHYEIGRFNRLSARLFRSERRLSLFGGLFGLSVNTIMTFLRLAVLGIGAWMILDSRFSVGGLVAFLGIMGEVLAPVTVLTGIGQQVQSATGALHRIDEVADEPPEYEDRPDAIDLPPLTQDIRLENVDFSYNTERQVLNDVSATIPAGARVAFVGASGSGKSTTLQLLMRLYDVDSGRITWDGIDIRSARVGSLRGQLGVVFQDSFLFDTTVRENIALGKLGATDEEVEAAARAAEVHDFISALPRGYDTIVGERGGLLSGGQRQRVAIARALVRNPRVLLLDEATSALDPKTERQITETLNRISSGRTTIAITHRLTSVVDYDRIFVMSEGQLVEQGSHDELVTRGGVYARLWSEQTGQAFAAAGPPPFDAASALARLSLFAGLSRADLDAIVARAKPVSLPANQSIPDGDGSLSLIASGRGRVLVPALGGGWAVAAEVSTGDSFGLSALLAGSATGAYLQAIENIDLLVLDDEAFAGISASYPTVAAGLAGHAAGASTAAPERGLRLTRMTTSMRAEDVEAALTAMRSTG
jgi:ABC-type multidrug transport system fused ATPase/permease subunit/CRP-like cAMP-binding protein